MVTFQSGFGNGWLKLCTIVHFWGGLWNILGNSRDPARARPDLQANAANLVSLPSSPRVRRLPHVCGLTHVAPPRLVSNSKQ